MKEAAGAGPLAVVVVSGVDIILTPERRFKAGELNAFGFFGVAFGLSDFVDHA
jgi:hypothetical protein